MAKGRKLKNVSNKVTELLDIDELKAINTDEYNIKAMSPDTAMPLCVECNGPVENHGRFERVLLDIVQKDDEKRFARLHYYFYKYRCLNPECSTVFQKPVSFVSENGKVTKRYENEVMRLLFYESIDNARRDMKKYVVDGHSHDIISKPAISKLVKRWIEEKDQDRKFGSPIAMAFYSFKTFYNDYLIVTDISKEPYKIIEVIAPVTELGIRQFMERVDYGGVRYIVTDYNPIVVDTIKMIIPNRKIAISTDSIKESLRGEFKEYINLRLMRYSKYVREMYLATAEELTLFDGGDLYKMGQISKKNEDLKRIYDAYSELYGMLDNHRDIAEVVRHTIMLSPDVVEKLTMTINYIKAYEKELVLYQYYEDGNGDSLYDDLLAISEIISQYFSVNTVDVFRARLLYFEFKERGKWDGVGVSQLLDSLHDMIKLGGLKKHER